ncbi:MAG: Rieske 2Fe-2S domain-containing protein, partial [Actinomycetota bacterium]|nr:Rieske 2Fe-2S domain-containing protein [Actinomycetota bacterium]
EAAFAEARRRPHPEPLAVALPSAADRVAILRVVPPGGWSVGVRSQRTIGLAYLTVDVPMGDLYGADFEMLSDLADRYCDGALNLSRDQNVVLRNVPVAAVADVRKLLRERNLYLVGEAQVASVRACTGSAVCALGITRAPDAGMTLLESPALGRNSSLRVHVSGCPNSCAQHQIGDIGFAGSKVRVAGRARDGYQVFLGADLRDGQVGEVVGRVAAEDARASVDAITGTWESLRHGSETLGQTVNRLGREAFAAHIEAVMKGRWETGPEPGDEPPPPPVEAVGTTGSFVAAMEESDLAPGSTRTFEVDGTAVALVNASGTICAVEDTCPHAGASLGNGTLDGWCLECPLHGAVFDVRTGEALDGPSPTGVRTFPVKVEAGTVYVGTAPLPRTELASLDG